MLRVNDFHFQGRVKARGLAGFALALAIACGATAAEADSARLTTCVRSGGAWFGAGGFTCVSVKRSGEGENKRSEREDAEAAERDKLWMARCKPVLRQDPYGVSRYHYSAPGCEFGRFED